MESGLLRLILSLLNRVVAKQPRLRNVDAMVEYLAGNAAWEFPSVAGESRDVAALERGRWEGFLTTLDTAILSMLGEREVLDADIETSLDVVLSSSLWSRRLLERKEATRVVLKAGLEARARHVWSKTSAIQRRGYFLAGIGLRTGKLLDEAAPELNQMLAAANGAVVNGNHVEAIAAIKAFAEKAFTIEPFVPEDLPSDWQRILESWLNGERIVSDQEAAALRFVEQALVYRLPWAMEAVRVRALANGDTLRNGLMMEDVELGLAVAAVETGTLNRSAAVLIRAGFSSRIAALMAVTQTGGAFTNMSELRLWLRSDEVAMRAREPDWPTAPAHRLWEEFIESLGQAPGSEWRKRETQSRILWDGSSAGPGTPVRLHVTTDATLVLDSDYTPRGRLVAPINLKRRGLLKAVVAGDEDYLDITYLGPNDLQTGY
jgi:hypothetical protein